MFQTTQRRIFEQVNSLRESDVLPFHEILDAKMVDAALTAEGVTFSERVYTPIVTLCLFLSQVLDPDHSCRAAVARLITWLAINGRKPCAPETGSYCQARQRLPLEVVVRLVRQTGREIDARAHDASGLLCRRSAPGDARATDPLRRIDAGPRYAAGARLWRLAKVCSWLCVKISITLPNGSSQ